MSTRRLLLPLITTAVLLATASLACGDDASGEDLFATLRIHGGTVEVDADGAGTFAAGTEGQILAEGATVRTGSDGRASIDWPDGSVTRLDFDTSLRISALERGSGVIASTVIEGEQKTGNTYSRVVDITETGNRFAIDTPTASAAVQGTTWAVLVNPDGSTSIVVTEGAVLVTTSSGEEVLVEAGSTVTISEDGSVTGPMPTPDDLLNSDWIVFNDDCDTTGECTTEFNAGGIEAIELLPSEAAINLGESQTYSAQGLDEAGNPTGEVAATFDLDGVPCDGAVCTPTAAGDYTVTATFGDHQATGTLAVLTPGDVQVTLDWGAVVDLDLWVTDPAGETVNWQNTESASGGVLDRDAFADCEASDIPPENTVWTAGAPSGEYTVTVHVFDICGLDSTDFVLTVRVGGQVVLVVDNVVLAGTDDSYEATFTVP
ncbi:MAG: FecR family protein [Acidimicrobiia bacterium]